LVTLSACQTALSDFRTVPDESFGFPSAFLAIGVPAVIGTLGSVNDLSTAILMLRFYSLYLQGDQQAGLEPFNPSKALCFAQKWMRDSKNNEKRQFLDAAAPNFKKDQPLVWESLRLFPDGQLFSELEDWAAFVCYG
jgi:CHAT domain-containing protein